MTTTSTDSPEASEPAAEATIEDQHKPVAVVDTREAFSKSLEKLALGHGPFAIDAERASGYRYSQRPYLIQIFREGSGVFLLDPPALGDLSALNPLIQNETVILHAALQDLPNLRSHGIEPLTVFDTELAGRLLNLERVGLATLLEIFLDIKLAKKYSDADWSTRPLPQEWLIYAALDVEYLPSLTTLLRQELVKAGKEKIAEAEFQYLLRVPAKPSRAEPWRRLGGIHQLKKPLELSVAKELWLSRDELAQALDLAPNRVLPDRGILLLAKHQPQYFHALHSIEGFNGKYSRSEAPRWLEAIKRGQASETKPALRPESTELPPIKAWERRNPEGFVRITEFRQQITALSEQHQIPAENLLTPEFLRQLAWDTPPASTAESFRSELLALGARPWQVELVAEPLYESFVSTLQKDLEAGSAH